MLLAFEKSCSTLRLLLKKSGEGAKVRALLITMNDQIPHEKQTHVAEKADSKKPYRKPEFRFERVFETAALACGKIAGTSAICNSSRKTS